MGAAGIRVNSISPGLIRTGFSAELMSNATFMQKRLDEAPLRRVGEAHEIAGVAVMLASSGVHYRKVLNNVNFVFRAIRTSTNASDARPKSSLVRITRLREFVPFRSFVEGTNGYPDQAPALSSTER
jgi:hypothetical protein